MNWGSWEAFWAMGGYGLYVWGSYAMAVVVAVIEIWNLKARRREAVVAAVRESARARSSA